MSSTYTGWFGANKEVKDGQTVWTRLLSCRHLLTHGNHFLLLGILFTHVRCGGTFGLPFFMVRAVGAVLRGRSAHTRTDPPKTDTELLSKQSLATPTKLVGQSFAAW